MTTSAVLAHPAEVDGESPRTGGGTTGREVGDEYHGEVTVEESSPAAMEAHMEVASPDKPEGEEEGSTASPEALAAPDGEGEATSDLLTEGYEVGEPGEETVPEAAESFLPEVGSTLTKGENAEFLPLLAAFAAKAVPMLTSTVGPALARALMSKLSKRAKRILAKPRPGGDMVAVLQRLLAQALKKREGFEEGTEEATGEAIEALVEELTQMAEVILGSDDRIRIRSTTKVPWRYYCALRIEFPSGAVYRGTGFFIGPRVLATAGHCVYAHDQGGWARRIEVIPGCDGSDRPFGSAFATKFRSTEGWTKNKLAAADYAAIILPAGAFPGQKMGSFGFKAYSNQELLAVPAVLAGYPGDKPFAELWGMRRKIKKVTSAQLFYDIDTMGGQSGAPVYIMKDGMRRVVGIHNYGASTGNSATRVTTAVMNNFSKWSVIGAPPKPPTTGSGSKTAQASTPADEEAPVDSW